MILNFSEQFWLDVTQGKKLQTIRRVNAYQPKEGEAVHLYCGLRTKQARCLAVGTLDLTLRFHWHHQFGTKDIVGIFLDPLEMAMLKEEGRWPYGEGSKEEVLEAIARADGFPDFKAMASWFEGHYDKETIQSTQFRIIRWKDPKPQSTENTPKQ